MLRHWRTIHHNRPGKPPAAKNLRPISIASTECGRLLTTKKWQIGSKHIYRRNNMAESSNTTPSRLSSKSSGKALALTTGASNYTDSLDALISQKLLAAHTEPQQQQQLLPNSIYHNESGARCKQLEATRNGGFAHHSIHRDLLILAKFSHKLTQRHPSA